jgi:glycosyltransferase involved in cell wall biosynthesis
MPSPGRQIRNQRDNAMGAGDEYRILRKPGCSGTLLMAARSDHPGMAGQQNTGHWASTSTYVASPLQTVARPADSPTPSSLLMLHHPQLVSVVLPVFNAIRPGVGSAWLHHAIESVLTQLDVNLELIVVNDGSVDDTDLALNSYGPDYRVGVLTLSRNLGYSSALNLGIAAARGQFIAQINSDDYYISLHKLASQLEALRRHHYDIVGTNGVRVHSGDLSYSPISLPQCHDSIVSSMSDGCPMIPGSLLFRKSVWHVLGGFTTDPRFRFSEDHEFLVRAACHTQGVRFHNISEPLYAYRDHPDRASNSQLTRALYVESGKLVRGIAEFMNPRD